MSTNTTNDSNTKTFITGRQKLLSVMILLSVPVTLWAVTTFDELSVGINEIGEWNYMGAFGYYNTSSEPGVNSSVLIGMGNLMNHGSGKLMVGVSNFDSGYYGADYSLAVGWGNAVGAESSAAIGKYLQTDTVGGVVVGKYNDTTEYNQDAVFVVGSGTSTSARKNALIVKEDGTVIIPKLQGDISMGPYGE